MCCKTNSAALSQAHEDTLDADASNTIDHNHRRSIQNFIAQMHAQTDKWTDKKITETIKNYTVVTSVSHTAQAYRS